MEKKDLTEKAYLLFRSKTIDFEVPDDFPEDQIPKFTNFKDFTAWYALQDFKPYTINDYSDEDKVIDFALSHRAKESVHHLINDINKYKHLMDGWGFPEEVALSLAPEGYLDDLSRTILPRQVYLKFKDKLLLKYPTKNFSSLIQTFIKKKTLGLNYASENFIEFLVEEGVDFHSFKFFDLYFSQPGSFEERNDWDEYSNPPFSLKKTELLLNNCNNTISNNQSEHVINEINNLIKTNQNRKLLLLLEIGNIPSHILKQLLHDDEEMNPKTRSLLLSYIK